MSAAVETSSAHMALPLCDVGGKVRYLDREGREQVGEVHRIDAHWTAADKHPLIVYCLFHPTYRNRHFYAGVDDILEVVP